MGFKNVDYNAHLRFDDDNPFKNAFEEAKAEAKASAEEAYDKKKEDFLDDFFINVRNQFNPPDGVQMVIGEGPNARLNKGFYKIMNLSPEAILSMAKKEAKKFGLSPRAIKRSDILNEELKGIKNESVKRHYMALNSYRISHGQNALNRLLKGEGEKFAQFYGMFTDPYTENTLHQGPYTTSGIHKETGFQEDWQKHYDALGYTFNKEGNLTNIPGFWDTGLFGYEGGIMATMPEGGYTMKYDENNQPYVTALNNRFAGPEGVGLGETYRDVDGEGRFYLPTAPGQTFTEPGQKKSEEIMRKLKEEEEARLKKTKT